MDYKELIDHILGNARAYLEDYSKKESLDDYEKGILKGLWCDVDSINSHINMDMIYYNDKELKKYKKELNLDKLLEELYKLSE